jgi:hypothetical protein
MTTLELTLLCIVCAGVALALGKLAFKKDTEIENRRRGAGQLAISLGKYGLKRIPAFLIDYSVGDYSGCGKKIKELAELFLSGEEAIVKEFDEVFKTVLFNKMQTAEGRAFVQAVLKEAEDALTKPKA